MSEDSIEHLDRNVTLRAGDFYGSYRDLPNDAVVGGKIVCEAEVEQKINELVDSVNKLSERVKKLEDKK